MPVVSRGRRSGQKRSQKRSGLSFDQKLAKLAIADFWHKDSDGTRYYVNVAVFQTDDGDKPMVRFRIDIPGEEPLILALDYKTAMALGMALQRAAFAAQVLTADEVKRLWAMAKGKAAKGEEAGGEEEVTTEEAGSAGSEAGSEEAGQEEELPDISFA